MPEWLCNCLCAATDRLAAAKSTAVNAHLHLMPSAIVSLCVNVCVCVCVYLCAYVCSRNYRQARARTQCHLHSLCVTWAFILFACAARTELKFYEFL